MSKRILVVEDQEDNRRILRYLLRSADYHVLEAMTGEDGRPAVRALAARYPRPGMTTIASARLTGPAKGRAATTPSPPGQGERTIGERVTWGEGCVARGLRAKRGGRRGGRWCQAPAPPADGTAEEPAGPSHGGQRGEHGGGPPSLGAER